MVLWSSLYKAAKVSKSWGSDEVSARVSMLINILMPSALLIYILIANMYNPMCLPSCDLLYFNAHCSFMFSATLVLFGVQKFALAPIAFKAHAQQYLSSAALHVCVHSQCSAPD